MDFIYQDPYPILKDDTQYKKITSDYVSVEKLGTREILTIDPKGLELLAQEAMNQDRHLRHKNRIEFVKGDVC